MIANAPTRFGMFAVAAVVALAAGYALGEAVGPIDSPPPPAHGAEEADVTTRAKTSSEPTRAAHDSHARTSPVGGYRIVAAPMSATAGVSQTLRFQVIDPSGSVVTDFAVRHGKRMHLVVVSSDVTRYAHLHPALGADGIWSVELPPLDPGGYRAFADFVPAGRPDQVSAFDLVVAGVATAQPVLEPAGAVAVEGLDIRLDVTSGGNALQAVLTVERDGAVVTPEPYLGARGHLVAIRVSDLSYLHVHPDDQGTGPVGFSIAGATEGRYRLFFDFSVDGVVRTAAFTVDIEGIDAGSAPTFPADHSHAPGEDHR